MKRRVVIGYRSCYIGTIFFRKTLIHTSHVFFLLLSIVSVLFFPALAQSQTGDSLKLVIDPNKIDEDLTDFPLLIYLSENSGINGLDVSDIFSALNSDSDRYKIAVETDSGRPCYVEIERWDRIAKKAWLWVRVPYVSSTQFTVLNLYYDPQAPENTDYVSDTGEAAAQNVWDANFRVVQHLGASFMDSTGNGNNGTNQGASVTPFAIGDGHDFEATEQDYIAIDNTDLVYGSSPFTYEITASVDTFPGFNDPPNSSYLVCKGIQSTRHARRLTLTTDGSVRFIHYAETHDTGYDISTGTTYRLTVTYDGSRTEKLYVDGALEATVTLSGVLNVGDTPIHLGKHNTLSNYYLDGRLDEFRESSGVRSDGWIKATYHAGIDNLVRYIAAGDTTAPTEVDILAVSAIGTGTTATLDWTGYDESGQGDIASYRIYVEPTEFMDVSGLTPMATLGAGNFTYTVEDLTEGVTYYFAVVAEDFSGNIGILPEYVSSAAPISYENAYAYKFILNIDHTVIDEELTDFPLLVHLSSNSGRTGFDASHIFTALSTHENRKKIAVTTISHAPCYVEIERWDAINQQAWLWVNVPFVSPNTGTRLYLYYDALQSDNIQYVGEIGEIPAQRVWNNGYTSVWHMAQDPNEDAPGAIKDSTAYDNHGSPGGLMTSVNLVDGKIGNAIEFDGIDDKIIVPNDASLSMGRNDHTVEAFVYLMSPENHHTLVAKRSGYGMDYNYYFGEASGDRKMASYNGSTATGADTPLEFNTWYNTVFRYTSGTIHFYRDGVSDGSRLQTSSAANTYDVTIGYNNVASYLNGIIDEVRISNFARSPSWIKATYYTNADELIYYTDTEDSTAPPSVDALTVDGGFDGATASLDWSGYDEQASGDIWRYRIYAETTYFTDISELTPIDTVPAGVFTYTAENLDTGITYYFAVVAVDLAGNGIATITAPVSSTITDEAGPMLSNVKIDGIELTNGYRLMQSAFVTLNASDLVGMNRIEFYMDGNLVRTDDSGEPNYYCYLDIGYLADGNHTLHIVSYDESDNATEFEYEIEVAFDAPKIQGHNQMQVGEQQDLYIMNAFTGLTYSWSIMAGGGSLSNDTGTSIIYTAPDANPNCLDNSIIRVTDSTGNYGEIEISVNAFNGDYPAYGVKSQQGDCIKVHDSQGIPVTRIDLNKKTYRCDGSSLCDTTRTVYMSGTNCEEYHCPCDYTCTQVNAWWCDPTYNFGEYFGGVECGVTVDMRTSEMKEQGCCYSPPPTPFPGPEGCPASGDCDCKKCEVGNPIHISSGSNFERETDVQQPSPAGVPFAFGRSYNSRLHRQGPIGYGWTHNYYVTLDTNYIYFGKVYLQIIDESGVGIYFQHIGDGKYVGAYKEKSRVEKDADTYIWNMLDGRRYGFSLEGRISWLEDQLGNRTELTYDTTNRLHKITDTASGRSLTLQYNEEDRIESVIGPVTEAVPDGIWVSYGYDASGNLTRVTYADRSGFDYSYNDPNDIHNLTEKRNKAGHLLSSWTYDDQDRAIENFTRDGRGVRIDYVNETGVRVTDAYGVTRTYTIGNMDGKKRVTDISGISGCSTCGTEVVRIEYNRALRVIEKEYANGLITQYDNYDRRGNAGTVREAVGTPNEKSVTYTYHPDINVKLSRTEPSMLGAGNKVTIWDYDSDVNVIPNENPTRLLYQKIENGFTKNASGTVVPYEYITSYTYNSKGQVTSVDGPLPGDQDKTLFAYDHTTGDLLSVTSPVVGTTYYADYDGAGNKGRITDPNGNAVVYAYDGRGRVESMEDLTDGSVTAYEYNTAGDLLQVTGPNGVTSDFEYDTTYGRMTKVSDPLGNYISYAYDDQGNPIEKSLFTPMAERVFYQRFDYQHPDHPGKLYREINPDDTYTAYDYDTMGNIQSVTDPRGRSTTYGYNKQNLLTHVFQPGNVITDYGYDHMDNLTSVTDAENHTTRYAYDDDGRMLSTVSPDTGTTTYAYDAAGNLISKTDANGTIATYTYDAANRLTAIRFPDANQDILYTYDNGSSGIGRLTGMTDPTGSYTFTYDSKGNLVEEEKTIESVTYTTGYTYDAAGVLTGVTYPNGRTVTYRLDAAGRVDQITTEKDGIIRTLAQNITYLPYGPISTLTYGNGTVLTQTFDRLFRPSAITATGLVDYAYDTDPVGNIMAITDNLDSARSRSFAYDDLNRITAASGIFGTLGYTYDKVGNRLSKSENGQTGTYTYQTGTHRLAQVAGLDAQSFTYDANGNTTARDSTVLTYNQNDRLIRVAENGTSKGEYTYNANGQRIKKTAEGKTTIYHYDRFGNLIGESDRAGNFIREYIYLNSLRLAAFAEEAARDIRVEVSTDEGRMLSGVRVYAFTESGIYTGKYAVTDEAGIAQFPLTELPDGSYKFRADYLSDRFWSEVIVTPGTYAATVQIQEEPAVFTVTRAGTPVEGIKVYLFNDTEAYLGLYDITDIYGTVQFDLPVGQTYKFRADLLGSQYFSEAILITDEGPNTYSLSTGGGILQVTVEKGEGTPISGITVYLFNDKGGYLGLGDTTDEDGRISFTVSSGAYKIRADYLGYQFWLESFDVTADAEIILPIPHTDMTVTVEGKNGEDIVARENIKVYLFTPTNAYLEQYQTTDSNGKVTFNLPCNKAYKVRADYLSQQFWSAEFTGTDETVTVEEGTAAVSVTGYGIALEGIKVYLFSTANTYLGWYGVSDAEGKVYFRLPEGGYKFRADYMGNQYWSGVSEILDAQENPVSISTGGGAFEARIIKDVEDPLVGVTCYLFTSAGAYLGKSAVTDAQGLVSFNLSSGDYNIRIDHLGYQFWTGPFTVPTEFSLEHTIAHQDVTITIDRDFAGDFVSGSGLKVYLFTPAGAYLGRYQVTDSAGRATFSLPWQGYKVRVDYLSNQFWSPVFTAADTPVVIKEGMAEVRVMQGMVPIEAIDVYVFNGSGSYLGLSGETDADGKINFRLPAADYQFRADFQGSQYWATHTITADQTNSFDLDTGGGQLVLTVQKNPEVPMADIKVYAFSSAGSYIGMSGQTDEQGHVSFALSEGAYMFRADYLGYKFWTGVYGIPQSSAEALTIPHQNVTVSVNQVYGEGWTPLENIKVYLFTESGAYMGQYETTDSSGQVVFNLPQQAYKVRADYLGSQYFSDVITWEETDIDIEHGKINIHVTENGADIENAPVYLFTESGSYLGKYLRTNASGIVSFMLPIKEFKFRVDYNGSKYWSDAITPSPHDETNLAMALEQISARRTNDPDPIRFDGTPPEKETVMLASLGTITGLISQSVVAPIPEKKIYYYLNDHLGTPIIVIDENNTVVWAADYKPFGKVNIVVETFENNFRFPGQYYDNESQLHYNNYRYYQPQIGRYLSADPSHSPQPEGATIPYVFPYLFSTPQEFNLFTYVSSNPMNLTDQMGLWDMISSYKILHKGYKPPTKEECGCITTHATCYKRCTWFFYTPISPDIPSLVTEGATKLFCIITCAITPCSWDDEIFDESPFWGY